MAVSTPQWSVVGSYYKRPVPQGEILDLLSAANNEAISAEDAPILLYDMSNSSNNNPSGTGSNVAAALRVPKYIAKKIAIPPAPDSSTASPASAESEQLKAISLAPPFPLQGVADARTVLNVDCAEQSPEPADNHRRSQQAITTIVFSTTIPAPSHLSFVLPFALFLADMAVLVVSLTTQRTQRAFIATCCVLAIVPDILALFFVVKKGSLRTSAALHLLLWANVILLFLQPYTSPLFFVHYILLVLMILFVLRVRQSSYIMFCRLI